MTQSSMFPLCYSFGDLTLEHDSLRLFRQSNEIRLAPLSGRLLLALVTQSPGTLTYQDMVHTVWDGRYVSATTIKQRIKLLRGSLGDDAAKPRYIALVRGIGYRLIPPVDRKMATGAPVAREESIHWLSPKRLSPVSACFVLLATALVLPGVITRLDSGLSPSETGASIPHRAGELYKIGEFLYHRRGPGDLRRAEESFLNAIEIAPHYAEPWVYLSGIYKIKRVHGALPVEEFLRRERHALERALQLQPSLIDARVRLASLDWSNTGSTDIFERQLEKALELEPLNPLALSKKASLLQLRGDWKSALAIRELAAAQYPSSITLQGNLAAYYLQMGRLVSAEKALSTLLELHPDLQDILATQFTQLRLLQGRPNEAFEWTLKVQDDIDRLTLQAMAFHASGKTMKARQSLEQVSRRNSPMALAKLAEARHFIDPEVSILVALDAILDSAKGDPARLQQARMAWSHLLFSPFVNWSGKHALWSQRAMQMNVAVSWAVSPNKLTEQP